MKINNNYEPQLSEALSASPKLILFFLLIDLHYKKIIVIYILNFVHEDLWKFVFSYY